MFKGISSLINVIRKIRYRHFVELYVMLRGQIYFLFMRSFYTALSKKTNISLSSKIYNKGNCYIDDDFVLKSWSSISGEKFIAGKNVRIGHCCHVFGNVKIGNDVMIAPNTIIVSAYHGVAKGDIPMVYQEGYTKGRVEISDDVWVGANAVILSGVKVGKGSIVAAGSIVTKAVPDYAIVAGNPAIVIGFRS